MTTLNSLREYMFSKMYKMLYSMMRISREYFRGTCSKWLSGLCQGFNGLELKSGMPGAFTFFRMGIAQVRL